MERTTPARSKPKRLCPCSSGLGQNFVVYLPLAAQRGRHGGGRHGVLAPVPHGGARSLQHVPWPATAPVSAFCPHPLARPGADARCATHRCFPRRSAGAAGARSGGENSPRFEDDDTVHTVRHFVPGKSQGREGDSRSDRSTSCWRCTSSRLLGLSRGGAAPCRQRLQSTVEQQVASIDARPTASRALRGRPRSIGARCALVLMDVCLAPLRVRARRHALQLQLGKPLA